MGDTENEEEQNPIKNLVNEIRERADSSTPDDAYHCPNCNEYSVTEKLQVVQRPEFNVENDVWGCAGCEHSMIPATEWRPMDPEKD